MRRLRLLRWALLSGGGKQKTFEENVAAQFGANLIAYYPLNETAGTVANDISGNARNGEYTGPTLAQMDFPAGGKAPLFDGTNDWIQIQSASLASAFTGAEMSIIVWYKLFSADYWANTYVGNMVGLYADDNNRTYILKSNSDTNKLAANYYAGGGNSNFINQTVNPTTGWCMAALSVTDAGDAAKFFNNAVQLGTTRTSVPTWSGAITRARIGAGINSSSPGDYFCKGYLAHVQIINRAITDAEILTQYNYVTSNLAIATLGDSITNGGGKWPDSINTGYNDARNTILNVAASGASIMGDGEGHLTAQVASVTGKNLIVVAMGTNDNNAGDMTALQAAVEAAITNLKATNPGAEIYWMNVLPRWTAVDGVTEVDKANIRAAVAAGCAARGVTCWDTYTTPWIEAADTSDGLHPTAGGQAKIAAEMLSLLAA